MTVVPPGWTWVFDLDNTLYPASSDLFAQVDRNMAGYIADRLRLAEPEARALQKRYYRDYGTTLRGLMIEHGMDPGPYLEAVHRIDLAPIAVNPRLDAALAALPGRKLIFTNGTVAHAENVMARIGVARHFEAVFDIVAADYVPKPDPACYDAFLARHGVDPRRAAMFEDLPRNLKPAHALGMATVLVTGHDELAQLERDGGHVHHVADDLAAFLEDALSHLAPALAGVDGAGVDGAGVDRSGVDRAGAIGDCPPTLRL